MINSLKDSVIARVSILAFIVRSVQLQDLIRSDSFSEHVPQVSHLLANPHNVVAYLSLLASTVLYQFSLVLFLLFFPL